MSKQASTLSDVWVGHHVTLRDSGKQGVVLSAASGYFKIVVDGGNGETVFSRKFNLKRTGEPDEPIQPRSEVPPSRRRRPASQKRAAPKIIGGPVIETNVSVDSSITMSQRWIGARVVLRDSGMKGTVLLVGNGYFKIKLDDDDGRAVSVRQANMRKLGETCKRSPNAASAAVAAAAMTQMAAKVDVTDPSTWRTTSPVGAVEPPLKRQTTAS